MSGFLGSLSAEQEAKLAELRDNLKDILDKQPEKFTKDIYLVRILRARKFVVKNAEKMYRDMIEARKVHKYDELAAFFDSSIKDKPYKPPQVLVDYFPFGILASPDKAGHRVIYYPIGDLDAQGLFRSVSYEDLYKFRMLMAEALESIYETSVNGRVVVIIDMKNLGMRHIFKAGVKFISETEKHGEDYVIMKIMNPYLDPGLRAKFEVISGDYQKKLLEIIPAAGLPQRYGGELSDEDCKKASAQYGCYSFGGTVPKEFYRGNDESYTVLNIGAGKKYSLKIPITTVGAVINWEFTTTGGDINFGVLLQPTESDDDDDKAVSIRAIERVASHADIIDGELTCDQLGCYVLVWDNGFSWIKGKTLKYKYEQFDPATIVDEILTVQPQE